MRRLLSLCCAAVLLAATAAPALAASGQSGAHPMMWYVSLGDSLAAGVQPTGVGTSAPTSQGYAEQLLAIARAHGMKVGLIKLGCSGETTLTFIEGGKCAYEQGSQLAQALVFLKAHEGKVAFITIDLGWNDFQGCDKVPLDQLEACIAAGAASVRARLPGILATLRTAAPGVPIVGATLYDPFLVFWFGGAQGQFLAHLSTDIIANVNGMEAQIYSGLGMPVADVQGAFQTFDWDPMNTPLGVLPTNVATICSLTWKCSTFQDNHANEAGYGVMAAAFWAAIPH